MSDMFLHSIFTCSLVFLVFDAGSGCASGQRVAYPLAGTALVLPLSSDRRHGIGTRENNVPPRL